MLVYPIRVEPKGEALLLKGFFVLFVFYFYLDNQSARCLRDFTALGLPPASDPSGGRLYKASWRHFCFLSAVLFIVPVVSWENGEVRKVKRDENSGGECKWHE